MGALCFVSLYYLLKNVSSTIKSSLILGLALKSSAITVGIYFAFSISECDNSAIVKVSFSCLLIHSLLHNWFSHTYILTYPLHCIAHFFFFFFFFFILFTPSVTIPIKKKKKIFLVLQHFLLLMLSCKNVNLWLFVLSLLSCLFIIYLMSLFCALCHRYVWHASSFICPAYCWWLCIGWFNLGLWLKWLRAGVDFRFKYYQ